MRRLVLVIVFLSSALVPALAVEPDEMLDDPVLEARARDISADLRCLVCQNQSIDDSSADLARDLRLLVRERLQAGDSDTEVVDYIVARYGEFVLLKPVFALHTLLLWAAAPAVFLIGLAAIVIGARRMRARPAAPGTLSNQEQAALDGLRGDEPRK